MSDEKLGHLIRKYRILSDESDINVPIKDLVQILNAADLGLYLKVQSEENMLETKQKLYIVEQNLREVLLDRSALRTAYNNDMTRIEEIGFKGMDEVLTFLEAYRNTGIAQKLPTIPKVKIDVSPMFD